MQSLISITQQWQLYIPEEIRKQLGLTHPGQAKLSTEKNKIIIEPVKSPILAAAGLFAKSKPQKKIDVDNIRDYIDYSQW
jgi:bifunctional DNA-binding transcriptional regulator/antitoxin component of YhaV-PrlF toxin-antitoxin module